ncbi:UNKNOWN [Stylonychia lemnae]|uniref:Uncharacterized protein n=1 Tax=Stylonychia lemnae TaxID=5949 RepID=A0A077ZRH1_STYLE|nr:UNKNOWN [Stylonychia lemnae]|eukprot:CDW72492.1 UNKNOWN [Stylonychia lemnae]
MIVEREQFFSYEQIESDQFFPSYIVVRRLLNSGDNDGGEWQGFMKDLKNAIRTASIKSKNEIIKNQAQLQKIPSTLAEQNFKIESYQKNVQCDLDQLKTDIGSVKYALDSLQSTQDQKLVRLESDMTSIKESMALILQKLQE